MLLEGSATVEAAGRRVAVLSAGSFVGSADAGGRPVPPRAVTVRLTTAARVLVLDPGRLAALIDTDPAAAEAWRRLPVTGRR